MPPVSPRSGLPNSKLWFLLGALLLGVLPLLLAAFFLPDSLSKQIRKASRKEMIHSAKTLASLVDREFSKNLSITRSLAEDSLYRRILSLPAGDPTREKELRELTSILKRTTRSLGPDFSGMFVCDATGKAVASVATGLPDDMGVGMDVSDRDYFKDVLTHRTCVMSQPLLSRNGGIPSLIFCAPIMDEHAAFLGMIALVVNLEAISKMIVDTPKGEDRYGFAVAPSGLIVAHPEPGVAMKHNLKTIQGAEVLVAEILGKPSGVVRYEMSTADKRRVAAFAQVPMNGWKIAVATTEEKYMGAVYRIRSWILWLAFGSAGLIVAASLYTLHLLAKRSEVQLALQDSQECFQKAFHSSPHALMIVSVEKHLVLAINEAFGQLFRIPPGTAKGKRVEELPLWTNEQTREVLIARIEKETRFSNWEINAPEKPGNPIHCLLSMERINVASEECYLLQIQDNTFARRAEEERQQLQSQVLQMQKTEALGQLSGGVAHDFNNVLTAIQLQVSFLAAEEPLSEAGKKLVSECMTTVQSGADLTSQLLQFSRRADFYSANLELKDVVGNLNSMLQRLIGCRHRLEVVFAQEELRVRGDRGKLQQIILNLVVNARDAMPEGGTIQISGSHVTRGENTFVCLQVTDTGTGMSKEVQKRLFEPFFTTKQPGRGTGLGLSTTFRIVKEHGGLIEVESELGKGSCFKVLLPVTSRKLPEATPQAPEMSTRDNAMQDGEQLTILYAEDELGVARLMQQVLTKKGCKVLHAPTAAEALKLFRENQDRVTLLVSDVMMPGGMLGTELALEVRRLRPDLPVLFTSGYILPQVPEDLIREEIAWLPKPFSGDMLLRAMEKLLKRN